MRLDVPEFVHLAALHEGGIAEEIADCAPQRLGPVDYPQPRALAVDSAIDKIGDEGAHHGGVLGAALAKPEQYGLGGMLNFYCREAA